MLGDLTDSLSPAQSGGIAGRRLLGFVDGTVTIIVHSILRCRPRVCPKLTVRLDVRNIVEHSRTHVLDEAAGDGATDTCEAGAALGHPPGTALAGCARLGLQTLKEPCSCPGHGRVLGDAALQVVRSPA